MRNDLPPRLPLTFFERHSRAAHLIMNLHDAGNNRDEVLIQLKNFIIQPRSESLRIDLGYHLWNESLRTKDILLQEVIAAYPKFLTSTLSLAESARVCNALTVFQCMASHTDGRMGLVKGKIQYHLYPYLRNTANVMRPVQLLRLSSLNLIDALTKFDESHGKEILLLILDTQLFSSCVHCIRDGDIPMKKVATLILMKILMQDEGLKYCCDRPDDFLSVTQILSQLVATFSHQIPSSEHLKYVVQCYLSLSRVTWADRAYDTVRTNFPQQLTDNTFHNIIREDPEIPNMLHQLVLNLNNQPPQ